MIGVNPATDNIEQVLGLLTMLDEVRTRFDIPTQSCVLCHITTALLAMERGAPVDLVFQSIAGTEAANRSFGIDLALLREARAAALSLGAPDREVCVAVPTGNFGNVLAAWAARRAKFETLLGGLRNHVFSHTTSRIDVELGARLFGGHTGFAVAPSA